MVFKQLCLCKPNINNNNNNKHVFKKILPNTHVHDRHVKCAELCRDVYKNRHDVLFEKTDDRLYIALEGSDTIKDWINNISFLLKRNDMHRGFTRYANRCKRLYPIENAISEYENISLSGHSLGAASMLIICYLLFLGDDKLRTKNVELVLFGAPMSGGPKFKKRFTQKVIEGNDNFQLHLYKHKNDIVNDLPSSLFAYCHVDELCHIEGDNNSNTNFIQDHDISQYIEALNMSPKSHTTS
jgi:hypothetical protein